MSERIEFTRLVQNKETKLWEVVCYHKDDCATGVHGAAIHFLRQQIIPAIDGPPISFEQSYVLSGTSFKSTDVENVTFGPFENGDLTDEVRVGYWFAHHKLYWPCTRAEWDRVLAAVQPQVSL